MKTDLSVCVWDVSSGVVMCNGTGEVTSIARKSVGLIFGRGRKDCSNDVAHKWDYDDEEEEDLGLVGSTLTHTHTHTHTH